MRRNKITAGAAAMLLCTVILSACGSNAIHGTDGMLAYMREQHGDALEYTGSVSNAAETVAWFTFDELNPTCSYMIFKNKGNDEYEPSYDPKTTMKADACWCLWNGGVAVHVEDADIAKILVNEKSVEADEYPFNAFIDVDGGLNFIYFLDKDGNVVK